MELKNFLLPLSLALLTTWALQYFFLNPYLNKGNESQEIASGRTFTAPTSSIEMQPLKRDVTLFAANHQAYTPTQAHIETPHATYVFSSQGGCLQQVTFKRAQDGQVLKINTLPEDALPEQACFLVALDCETPYHYSLEKQEGEQSTQIVCHTSMGEVNLKKVFTVHHDTFQIDLALWVTPRKAGDHVRIFYSAPSVAQVSHDTLAGIYNTPSGSLAKETRAKIDMGMGWFLPTIFGAEDRYFVHSLVADPHHFAQRAYYSVVAHDGLLAILETAKITEPTEWHLSFYVGPKEEEALTHVDPRLTQTLEYSGWLAPLSRLLLKVLKYLNSFVHNYGWAIIVMTLLINILLLPLNIKSAKDMKKSAEFQKKLAYIKQRYKDDPESFARENSELISKSGMSLIGGCLPNLLQLPIFFALSRVLSSSIELYKAPFIGWIHDLSATDPYHVLPVLIMLSMMFASPATDPKQRFTMIALAMVFGAVTLNFSAGLCLYILGGIVLKGIQMLVQQKMKWA